MAGLVGWLAELYARPTMRPHVCGRMIGGARPGLLLLRDVGRLQDGSLETGVGHVTEYDGLGNICGAAV